MLDIIRQHLMKPFVLLKIAILTQKQNVEAWKKQQTNNPNGVVGNDIHQFFYLNSEPDAKVTYRQLTAADGVVGGNIFYYNPSNTSGDLVEATYTNLKNSYIVDQNGVAHKITKIVRVFSNLKGAFNTESVQWAKHVLSGSKKWLSIGTNDTILQVNPNPATGAMYFNASSVSVKDTYYDSQGNKLDPTGGYYVASSLNHSDYNDDIEGAAGTSVTAQALIGSSVSVQSDGSLKASSDNIVGPNGTTADQNAKDKSKIWDDYSSPYFYWGAGLLKINSSNPSLTFFTQAGSNALNSFWFTINTQIPYAPIQSTVHYHYVGYLKLRKSTNYYNDSFFYNGLLSR